MAYVGMDEDPMKGEGGSSLLNKLVFIYFIASLVLLNYRSVVAYRKTHHFLIIFDFDIIFLCQNSCLSQNRWHHLIRLALLHWDPFISDQLLTIWHALK